LNYEQQSKQINTLQDGAGEPWLIKFQAKNEHPEVCAIENVYAALARACGLEMPQTQHFELGTELAAFGIKRFDRHETMRIPTLSLAGLLDVDFRIPSVNYETFLRATRLITRSEHEVERAFERCVFNVIFHNRDDHAKNFSYRMNENFQWRLSPCYDLTFNEGPGGEHQMDIQGEGKAPSQSHLLQLALTNSVKRSRALEILDRVTTVAGSFSAYAKDSPIRAKTVKDIEQKIAQNRLRMR
jgi:serine/threonine-protein kinase HipA